MTPELISPDKEPLVRLLVFGAALIAIAIRDDTQKGLTELTFDSYKREARLIADAVIEEAKRLQGRQETPT